MLPLPICRCGTTLLMMANERRFPVRYDKDCVHMLPGGLTDAQSVGPKFRTMWGQSYQKS